MHNGKFESSIVQERPNLYNLLYGKGEKDCCLIPMKVYSLLEFMYILLYSMVLTDPFFFFLVQFSCSKICDFIWRRGHLELCQTHSNSRIWAWCNITCTYWYVQISANRIMCVVDVIIKDSWKCPFSFFFLKGRKCPLLKG